MSECYQISDDKYYRAKLRLENGMLYIDFEMLTGITSYPFSFNNIPMSKVRRSLKANTDKEALKKFTDLFNGKSYDAIRAFLKEHWIPYEYSYASCWMGPCEEKMTSIDYIFSPVFEIAELIYEKTNIIICVIIGVIMLPILFLYFFLGLVYAEYEDNNIIICVIMLPILFLCSFLGLVYIVKSSNGDRSNSSLLK